MDEPKIGVHRKHQIQSSTAFFPASRIFFSYRSTMTATPRQAGSSSTSPFRFRLLTGHCSVSSGFIAVDAEKNHTSSTFAMMNHCPVLPRLRYGFWYHGIHQSALALCLIATPASRMDCLARTRFLMMRHESHATQWNEPDSSGIW